jgi:hypothetical protein
MTGTQRPKVPQPADEQVRPPPRERHRCKSDSRQQGACKNRLPERRLLGKEGIEHRQPHGGEALPQVPAVGDECVRRPDGQWEILLRSDGSAAGLGHQGDGARRERERQKRELFSEKGPSGGCGGRPPSAKGPAVQEQKDARKGDQHRLAHQPQGEEEKRQSVVKPGAGCSGPGELRPPGVGPED